MATDIKNANAYRELLEILKYLPREEYEKIPSEFLKKFRREANYYYSFEYNPAKTLKEQNVSVITQKIINVLYKEYIAKA